MYAAVIISRLSFHYFQSTTKLGTQLNLFDSTCMRKLTVWSNFRAGSGFFPGVFGCFLRRVALFIVCPMSAEII